MDIDSAAAAAVVDNLASHFCTGTKWSLQITVDPKRNGLEKLFHNRILESCEEIYINLMLLDLIKLANPSENLLTL